MNDRSLAVLQLIVAAGVIGAGLTVASHLVATAPDVARAERKVALPQVEFSVAHREDAPLELVAHGVTRAARRVRLRAEITGVVDWISPFLIPGQQLETGAELLRIDDREYRLALAREEAALHQAEQSLEIEAGKSRIARKEWDLFKKGTGDGGGANSLALRVPQLAQAQAVVDSARARVEESRLELERTRITAPFNGFVEEKHTELGALVTPQTDLLELVGTDLAWVEVPLPSRQLDRVRIPGVNSEEGSRVRVRGRTGAADVWRDGRVIRLLGSLDERIRLPRVLVEVWKPYRDPTEGGLPLLMGTYVTVHFDGKPLEQVVEVPRRALLERDRLLVLDEEDRVRIRDVRVAWSDDERAWISEGVEDGERFLVSRLPSPVDGMRVVARPGAEVAE